MKARKISAASVAETAFGVEDLVALLQPNALGQAQRSAPTGCPKLKIAVPLLS
ncbi:MAG: hypothetical protein ACOH1L_09140 [Thermomonas sp.]